MIKLRIKNKKSNQIAIRSLENIFEQLKKFIEKIKSSNLKKILGDIFSVSELINNKEYN